jgi:hypothetical protein
MPTVGLGYQDPDDDWLQSLFNQQAKPADTKPNFQTGTTLNSPARPTSRGATFGANYQALPTSSRIDDRRQEPTDYAYWLRRAPGAASSQYPPSEIGGGPSGFVSSPGYDPMPLAGNIGPNPPISRLPISPGDPGWTPPPSPSGPHNLQGDPNRPGYGAAIGMPNTASSQFSPQQQLINFLQSWRGGMS